MRTAVGAAERTLQHAALLGLIREQDEPEGRPATRTGEDVGQQNVHAAESYGRNSTQLTIPGCTRTRRHTRFAPSFTPSM